ncbi:hypothetical protein [Azospirillum griseum]|uniref:Uncharacterized protein n=1 Tax=Azospirillum griseum TaxID=2496639 RepID=A0A431VGW2_9PROT|nr:hypothetical protein [Azospirillum griseum]RTR19780.1 hypothetical protein EJ903_12295 [Azospirillum griseum]
MPLYSVDDFQPSDFKKLNRIDVVQKTAEISVKTCNRIALRDHNLSDAVCVKEDGASNLVKAYFYNVSLFKVRNAYKKDQRINQEKICALLLKTCTEHNWAALFSQKSADLSDDFMEKMFIDFTFKLICAFAGVKDTSQTGNLERDFQICMHENSFMTDEWACWMMTSFIKAYGGPMGCEE